MDIPSSFGFDDDDTGWGFFASTDWRDPLEGWTRRVEPGKALNLISLLRHKYHHGPAEREILSLEERTRLIEQARIAGPRDLLPDDVREFRMTHYGDALEDLPFGAAGLVPTSLVLPEKAVTIRMQWWNFSGISFPDKPLYLSYLTTGHHVYEATFRELSDFFSRLPRRWEGEYFVFPEDVSLCFVIDTRRVQLVGDFSIFEPVSSLNISHMGGAPKVGQMAAFPGQRLSTDEAVRVVSEFRRKYHQGPPEKLLSRGHLERMSRAGQRKTDDEVIPLPDDVREFRMKHYGEPFEGVGLSLSIPTWQAFPPGSLPVRLEIFSHPHFLAYEQVYFSWRSLGDFVSVASPAEIQAYVRNMPPKGKYADYFVFDAAMRWCIAITHTDFVIISCDLNSFAPLDS